MAKIFSAPTPDASQESGKSANPKAAKKILIFAQTKSRVDYLERTLSRKGYLVIRLLYFLPLSHYFLLLFTTSTNFSFHSYKVESIHGGRTQAQRDLAINGTTQVLMNFKNIEEIISKFFLSTSVSSL